jgi:hypothetical protein
MYHDFNVSQLHVILSKTRSRNVEMLSNACAIYQFFVQFSIVVNIYKFDMQWLLNVTYVHKI